MKMRQNNGELAVPCTAHVVYNVLPWPRIVNLFSLKGYSTPGPFFFFFFFLRLCIFSKNKATLDTHTHTNPIILVRIFQGTQKSQFYFSRFHCCEVTVKYVRKSIFSMFWPINKYPLELVKFQCSNLFPWSDTYKKHILLLTNVL